MSEITELRKSFEDFKSVVLTHIAETNTYRSEKDKVVSALAKTVWDDGNAPGLATKVDRLNETEKGRKWFLRALGGSSIALIIKELWHLK